MRRDGDSAAGSPDDLLAVLGPARTGLQLALDALPFYALIIDDRHHILLANRATQRDLGLSPDALVGAYCPQVVHALTGPFPGCPLEEAVRTGSIEPVERELHDERHGTWFSSSVYPLAIAAPGGRRLFLHLVRDVTPIRRSEQERDRERHAQTVLADILRLALTDTSLDELLDTVLGRLIAVPWLTVEARGAIFLVDGDPPVLVMRASRALPAWAREKCRRVPFGTCLCGRAAASGMVEFAADLDERHEHCDEQLPPHGHYCVPIAAGGRVLGVINLYLRSGHTRDAREELFLRAVADVLAGIVERRRAEDELRRHAMAVAQSAEAAAITDAAGRIEHVNDAFEQVTGHTRGEVVGTPILDEARGFGRELRERIMSVVERDGVWRGRLGGTHRNGAPYRHVVTISPVHDGAGAVAGYIALAQDVTKEDQLEAQLRQAQKMEALGQLAAGVAHDFKNMLFVIQASAERLARELPPEDPRSKHAERIRGAVARGSSFTRQLLAFGREDEQQLEPLRLEAVVRDVARLFPDLLGPGIALELQLAEGTGEVHADRGHLEQVLVNLVVNARDAMPDGGRLTISTGEEEVGPGHGCDRQGGCRGTCVVLRVADTGTGMDEATRARIFEPFFTTKPRGKGTGLGLSIVYGLIQQAGGCIDVVSAPGRGATFTVYLPRAAESHVGGSRP